MKACLDGNLELAQYLVENGADVNFFHHGELMVQRSYDKRHPSPIHCAIDGENLDIVELLLKNGADPNVSELQDSFTPVMRTARRGLFYSITQFVFIKVVVYLGDLEILKLLLVHGADVMLRDKYGYTALHHCARRGFLILAEVLLIHGADINAETQRGDRPIHQACKYGELKMVKYLHKQGANLTLRNNEGISAMEYAANNGHEKIVKYLRKYSSESVVVKSKVFYLFTLL